MKNKNITNSYLIIARKKELSEKWFFDFANELEVKNTDIFKIDNDKEILLDEIKGLKKVIKLRPYESKYKLFFIYNADNIREQAANAMLKTLEEPPGQAIIVLAATNPKKILTTIVSRCRLVRLDSTNSAINVVEGKMFQDIELMDVVQRFKFAKDFVKNNDINKINEWMNQLALYYRTNIDNKKVREKLKKLLTYQKMINSSNVSKELVMENILLEL